MVKRGVLRGLALYRAICQYVINALRKGKKEVASIRLGL